MIAPWEVLIIEDDELDRTLVNELLALRGRGRAKVTEARDLKTGLELLAGRAFDLVLLDTKLPDASALYALRAVGDQAPDTPILPHTGYITPQTRQTARQRGAFEAVVRGELNPLWGAAHKLLTLGAAPGESHPAIQAVGG
jgi:CheY-like chemotaxis protein